MSETLLLSLALTEIIKKVIPKWKMEWSPLLMLVINVGLVMLYRQSVLFVDILDGIKEAAIGSGMYAVAKSMLAKVAK